MGWFFGRKKQKKVEPVEVEETYDAGPSSRDMVALIKKEQENDDFERMLAESEGKVAPLSYAKKHGNKYVSVGGKGQLASSKVVDVRSYIKPVDKPVNENKKFDFEKELDGVDKAPPSKSKSFFDDLLASINEEDDELNDLDKDDELIEEPVKPVLKPKVVSDKPVKKRKKKKSIDIDIISGDFGGSDII